MHMTVCSDQDTELRNIIKDQIQQQRAGWVASDAVPSPGGMGATQALLDLCCHIRSAPAHGNACVLMHPAMDPGSASCGVSSDVSEVYRLLSYATSSCVSHANVDETFVKVRIDDRVIVDYNGRGTTVYTGIVVAIRPKRAVIVDVSYVGSRSSRSCKQPTVDPSLDYKVRYDGWKASSDCWHVAADVKVAVDSSAKRHEVGVCTCSFSASRLLVPPDADTSSSFLVMSLPQVCLSLREPASTMQLRHMIAFCRVVQLQYGMHLNVAFIVDPCITAVTDADCCAGQVSVLKDTLSAQASSTMVFQFVPTAQGGWVLLTLNNTSGKLIVGDAHRSTADRRRMCRDLQLHMTYARHVKDTSALQGAAIPSTSAIGGWYSDIPDTSADNGVPGFMQCDEALRLLLLVLAVMDSLAQPGRLANRAGLIDCIRSPWPEPIRLQMRQFVMTCIMCGSLPSGDVL